MPRLVSILALLPVLLLACGGSKPPDVKVPDTAATGATAPKATPTADANSGNGTSGNVAISEEIKRACGIDDTEAFFPFDSSRLRNEDVKPLDKIAQCFTTGPLKGRAIRLVGRADPRGPTEYNMLLGHQRADSVGGYLTQHGMQRSKTESTSRGSMDAAGSDEPSWAKDRRVDVLLGN